LPYRITLAVEGRPEAFDQYEPRRSEEMSKERFMTVVYRIEDAEKSKAYRSTIGNALASEGQIADTGLSVVGMSVYD
jgi:hypothetical protein